MAGDCPGKTEIEDVSVYIHEPNDNDGTTHVHIDLEDELLSEIIGEENTFLGAKPNGAFIGLKDEQAERAEEIAANLRLQRRNTPHADT